MRTRSLLTAAVVLTAVSAAMWGAAIADVWLVMPRDLMSLDRIAAATTAILAAICWMATRRERFDAQAELYIQVIADVTRPARPGPTTGPLPLHLVR